MHLFFDTVWKLHIGEIPEKPKKEDHATYLSYYPELFKYNEAIAAIKQNALTVANPILCPQNMSAVEPGKFYEWLGGYETKEKDIYVEAGGNYIHTETITVAILTLPEEKKNTMENMTKELIHLKIYNWRAACGSTVEGMRGSFLISDVTCYECLRISSSGSVAAPKEESSTIAYASVMSARLKEYSTTVQGALVRQDLAHVADLLTSMSVRLKEREEALKELLEGLENLNSYAPDFPEYPNSLSQFDLGLSKASKDAKAIIERARKLLIK